jgi:hypothetical protein
MNNKYLCEKFLENDLDHLSIVLDLLRAFSQQSFCFIFLYFHFSNFFLLLLQTEIRKERSNLRKKKKLRLSEKISFSAFNGKQRFAFDPFAWQNECCQIFIRSFWWKKNEKYFFKDKAISNKTNTVWFAKFDWNVYLLYY